MTSKGEIDWLKMEQEIREVLRKLEAGDFGGYDEERDDVPYIIDEIIAFYTRRGNELKLGDRTREQYRWQYPEYFNRKW